MVQRKWLYSILLPRGPLRTLLDAIRLFAKPTVKYPAHVTVRGPYENPADTTEWEAAVRGQLVTVDGVGSFFENTQNTVFLKIDSPAVRAVWDKPDYPDYNPHVTLCDTSSRSFAEEVLAVISANSPKFSFHADGLDVMVLGNDHSLLREDYDPERLAEFMKQTPSLADIDSADDATRIVWIAELAVHLPILDVNR